MTDFTTLAKRLEDAETTTAAEFAAVRAELESLIDGLRGNMLGALKASGIHADDRTPSQPKASGRPAQRRQRKPQTSRRPPKSQQQLLEAVHGMDGVWTVRQLGDTMGVDPTGLYRRVERLVADGTLRRVDNPNGPGAAYEVVQQAGNGQVPESAQPAEEPQEAPAI